MVKEPLKEPGSDIEHHPLAGPFDPVVLQVAEGKGKEKNQCRSSNNQS
jgi:hypothetical protein